MKPYDKLTIIRNRHRARDLRRFRELVDAYFDRADYGTDELPVDWEGARAARSEINRMLPRVMQIVDAAKLDTPVGTRGTPVADVGVLRKIFNVRYTDGQDQDILDVIDMALGVYEASRFNALARTFNPLHYIGTALGYVVGLPVRLLSSLRLWPQRRPAARLGPDDLARLESVASRLAEAEELIEMRFVEMREWQSRQLAEQSDQLTELAERLDFAERVLARPESPQRLPERTERDANTPV